MQDLAVTNESLSVVIFVATYFSFICPRKPKLSMNIRVRIRDQSTAKISKSFPHPLSTNISRTISQFMLQKVNNLVDTLLDYADKSVSRQDCGKKCSQFNLSSCSEKLSAGFVLIFNNKTK